MHRVIISIASAIFAAVSAPAFAQEVEPASLQQGEELYGTHCAVCHEASGAGAPPTFPALRQNATLEDLEQIVGNIHQGKGAMPPFPDLTAEEIAALATFIRNSWGNSFGPVSAEDVTPILETMEPAGDMVSVWEGVYTQAQADRGLRAYLPCGTCHGRRLNGAPNDPDMPSTPPLARAPFLRNWDGKTVATLFEYTRATMPQNNPGSLTDEQYIDIIAYMFSQSGMPAGQEELPVDPESLSHIIIEQQQP